MKWGIAGAVFVLRLGGCAEPPPAAQQTVASVASAAASATVRPSQSILSFPQSARALTQAEVGALLPTDQLFRLEVSDFGSPPRRRLSYGAGQDPVFEASAIVQVEKGAASLVHAVLALKFENEPPEGHAAASLASEAQKVQFAVRTITASGAPGSAKLAAELKGTKGELALNAAGGMSLAPKLTQADLKPGHLQIAQGLLQGLADAALPLPAQALGDGASWVAIDRLQRAGVSMLRMNTCRLFVQGERHHIEVAVQEIAIAQAAADPALGDVSVQVVQGMAVGKRALHFVGPSAWPFQVRSEIASDVLMHIRLPLQSGSSGTSHAQKVTITGLFELRQR